MTFPAPFTVGHSTCSGFSEDGDGNSIPTYSASAEIPAYCWGPHTASSWSSVEARTDTTYLETAELDLFLPKTTVDLKDLFTVDGVVYEVVDVADWTHGFHGWQPGVLIALNKWEG